LECGKIRVINPVEIPAASMGINYQENVNEATNKRATDEKRNGIAPPTICA
jgi:hypothetical protein